MSADVRPVTDSSMVSTYTGEVAFEYTEVGTNDRTLGFVRSMVMVALVTDEVGPVLPVVSATEFALWVKMMVPSPHPVNVTVADVPDAALTVPALQPVAVPERVKSPMAKPVIDSLNVAVNTMEERFVGDVGPVIVTVGAVRSTVMVVKV
jgi:hypothetical protein